MYCPLGGRLLRGTGSDTDERCQGQTQANEKEVVCVKEAGLRGRDRGRRVPLMPESCFGRLLTGEENGLHKSSITGESSVAF